MSLGLHAFHPLNPIPSNNPGSDSLPNNPHPGLEAQCQ
jgi:hypothetical protein